MVTRQTIDSGAYLKQFQSMPNLWTLEEIIDSLEQTLKAKPADTEGIWIFAYGSLMWNPTVEFEALQVATLRDWQRSFCLDMTVGRASNDMPGRMLALRPGGQATGLALLLGSAKAGDELRRLWIREMVLGSYRPTWVPVSFASGDKTHAIAFVADETRDQFRADATVATVAPLIGDAFGEFGTNAEYLFRLQATLSEWGLSDEYIDAIAGAVTRRFADHPCAFPDVSASPSAR
jgi:glutathione-specific gamma-glutamylcyclotransferase